MIKLASILLFTASVMTGMLLFDGQTAHAANASNFKPGRIIDNQVFTDSNTMSTSQIKSLLKRKLKNMSGGCDVEGEEYYNGVKRKNYSSNNPAPFTCLIYYYENPSTGENNYGKFEKNSNGSYKKTSSGDYVPVVKSGMKSSAQIINDVANKHNINPQVLIVLLQKEQSLVSDDWPWKIQYRSATGYGCPDTADCDSDYYGFYNQVERAANMFRKLMNQSSGWTNWYPPGNAHIQYHPNENCGGSNIDIKNLATSALYNYTPYQPNQAALNNLYGTGDGCSAYGNRNFWRDFTDWFGSTTGKPVIFRVSGSATHYLEWKDYYYPIPSTDIMYAYEIGSLPGRVVSNFPAGKERGAILSRSAKFGSDDPNDNDYTGLVEVVDRGRRHGVPNWSTLSHHGYNDYHVYDKSLGSILSRGDSLRPVVRQPNGAIYAMDSGKKRGFPDSETYSTLIGLNYKGVKQTYSDQQLTRMSYRYLKLKSTGAPMLLNGKILKSSSNHAIYMHEKGKKRLFSASVYGMWGGGLDYKFSQSLVNKIPDGNKVPRLVSSSEGKKYLVDSSKKKLFDAKTQKAWGFSDVDFQQFSNRSLSRLTSARAKTAIQSHNSPAVYVVQNGKRHGVPSLEDFSRLGLSWSEVDKVNKANKLKLPEGPLKYGPGSLLRTPNGAVYIIDEDFKNYSVPSGAMFKRFGFNWNDVRDIGSNRLDGYSSRSLTTFLTNTDNGNDYVVEGGVYRYLSPEAKSTKQYDFGSKSYTPLSSKTLEAIDKGSKLTRFLRGPGSNTVYYIENGQRRPFSTQDNFFSCDGTWSKVVDVSDDFLSEIPRGSIKNGC